MASSPVNPMSDMNYSAYTATQSANSETAQLLATFWPRITNEIRNKPILTQKSGSKKDEPIQELPLARIKKIMKQDGEVKMISAEAPILFSKAAEIFISELSLRAWIHTEDNKRRTLQRNDIAMAITKYDQFDFLIDIVPRDELKPPPPKRQEEIRQPTNVMAPEQVQYYFQLSHLQNPGSTAAAASSSNGANSTSQITQLPAGTQLIQQPNGQLVIGQISAVSQQSMVGLGDSDSAGEDDSQEQSQTLQIQRKVDESSLQVQFTGPNQQVQYIRIPQSALNSSNLSQILQLQQQLQQQQQQTGQQQNQQSNDPHNVRQQTSHQHQHQQQEAYSQMYDGL